MARSKDEHLELAQPEAVLRSLPRGQAAGWPEFIAVEPQGLLDDLATLLDQERAGLPSANEAQTEERLIKPILERLGFAFTVQADVATAGARRQPDYALFVDDADRAAAAQRSGGERFHHAVAGCDAKRFDRPLDKRGKEGALSGRSHFELGQQREWRRTIFDALRGQQPAVLGRGRNWPQQRSRRRPTVASQP